MLSIRVQEHANVNMISFGDVNHVMYQGTAAIIMQELKKAMGSLKNGKGTGLDEAAD